MAKDSIPSLQSLEKPEDLKTLLKQEAGDDCMSCRIVGKPNLHPRLPHSPSRRRIHVMMFRARSPPGNLNPVVVLILLTGSGTLFGLAAFNYITGMSQLESRRAEVLASKSRFGMGSRRAGITMLSLGLAWMGVWRMVR
jgi:hypothetical protein